MNVERILEGLSQEERLALLERLLKQASEQDEEELSTEERLDRLEEAVYRRRRRFGFGPPRWRGRRAHGPEHRRWGARFGDCPCPCC
jgi:hypothetical protein